MTTELDAIVLGSDLSPREVEVLSGAAEGLSNAKIGAGLFLSEFTVKSHFARIARKLGTGDRTGMVGVAYRRGILPVSSVPAALSLSPGVPMLTVPAVLASDALEAIQAALEGRLRGSAYIAAQRVSRDLQRALDAIPKEAP